MSKNHSSFQYHLSLLLTGLMICALTIVSPLAGASDDGPPGITKPVIRASQRALVMME